MEDKNKDYYEKAKAFAAKQKAAFEALGDLGTPLEKLVK